MLVSRDSSVNCPISLQASCQRSRSDGRRGGVLRSQGRQLLAHARIENLAHRLNEKSGVDISGIMATMPLRQNLNYG